MRLSTVQVLPRVECFAQFIEPLKPLKLHLLRANNQWRWSVEREIKICSPQSYRIPLFSRTFDHDWIFPGLFCWWTFSRTRPMKIHLRVFWFFPLKKHLSRQGRNWTWCQFPGKLDSNFFTLLQVGVLNLSREILDVVGLSVLGFSGKLGCVQIEYFSNWSGKLQDNFPSASDRIYHLQLKPHLEVIWRPLMNQFYAGAFLWGRWSRSWGRQIKIFTFRRIWIENEECIRCSFVQLRFVAVKFKAEIWFRFELLVVGPGSETKRVVSWCFWKRDCRLVDSKILRADLFGELEWYAPVIHSLWDVVFHDHFKTRIRFIDWLKWIDRYNLLRCRGLKLKTFKYF